MDELTVRPPLSKNSSAFLPASPFPGQPPLSDRIDRALRVDWAGEQAAEKIYGAQLAILGPFHPLTPVLEEMRAQESIHAQAFEARLLATSTRPSLLQPLWKMAGTILGSLTAYGGEHGVMACTVAVEEVIDAHYRHQVRDLEGEAPELAGFLEKCRQDEAHHLEVGQAHLHHGAVARWTHRWVRWGTRCAVAVAQRI
jgi:ubiquinone biosynthesis monooxygenase Coq7